MRYWLKSIGVKGARVPHDWLDWRPLLLERALFKSPPSMRQHDLLAYYAVGHKNICAVAEVTSQKAVEGDFPAQVATPEETKRLRWAITIRPRLVIRDLRSAPLLRDAGIAPVRMRQQSHIEVTEDEFLAIQQALVNAGAERSG
jgi:hypothetical protein